MFDSITGTTEISCIDHVYTNAKNICSKPTIRPFGSSDHDLVMYTRYSTNNPTNSFTVRKRSYKNFQPTKFLQDLKGQDWTMISYCMDLDMAVKMFTTIFLQILDMHAPWIIFQKRKNFKPWVTDELIYLIKQRDYWKNEMKSISINTPTNTHIYEDARKNFKYYRNQINNQKKQDEDNYKRKVFEDNK